MKNLFSILLIAVCAVTLMSTAARIKTQLHITVRNDLGNLEEGVKVQLYEKEEDYKAETQPAFEGYTDAKGVVKFKDVKAVSYFLLARKDDKDNFGGGEQTGKLQENRINKVTVIIQ